MVWAAVALVLIFGLVVLRGAPYLNSHGSAVEKGLDLAGVKPGDKLVDLGSGSGNILRAAAKRGAEAEGIELNPLLYLYSRLRLLPYGGRTKVVWGDFWLKELPKADIIYVFITSNFAPKMSKFLTANANKPAKVLSYAYELPGLRLLAESDGYFLYELQPVAKRQPKK